MRRAILLALLFALYAAPLTAAEPALERIYDAEPLQRELPGFPKPRPGGADLDGADNADGSDTALTLPLGSGQSAGQGSVRGVGDSLRIELEGGGDGRGRGSSKRGDAGGEGVRRGDGAQGAGQGGLDVERSGDRGSGGAGERSGRGGAVGRHGKHRGAGKGGGQGDGAVASPAPSKPPAALHEPALPKLTPQERPDPSGLIFKIVGVALLAALLVGLIVWLARRVRERAAASAQAAASPNAVLEELAVRAGDAPPSTLAEQGRWAEAIHALLWEALRGVLAREAELGQPSLTARAICARAALGEAARGALATLVQAAELCVFAGEQADQQLYLRCAAAADALRAELERGGAR
jgi:hypothetical protein